MPVFSYGQTELSHLKRKDKKLARIIEQIGPIERAVNPDLFSALIHSIVAQQIATKAAATVWNRLLERCGAQVAAIAVAFASEVAAGKACKIAPQRI